MEELEKMRRGLKLKRTILRWWMGRPPGFKAMLQIGFGVGHLDAGRFRVIELPDQQILDAIKSGEQYFKQRIF